MKLEVKDLYKSFGGTEVLHGTYFFENLLSYYIPSTFP